MNPYQYETTCELCGEPCIGHVRDAGLEFFEGNFFYHRDPLVCRDNIERKEKKVTQPT